MVFFGANRTRQKVHAAALLAAVAVGCLSTGCGKKEVAQTPAATPPAAQGVPVPASGTPAVGVSPSNTISQKEQAEMAAEKTAGGGK